MAFMGLILVMGIVQLSDIKEYWSVHGTLNLSFFRYIYTQNAILQTYNKKIISHSDP